MKIILFIIIAVLIIAVIFSQNVLIQFISLIFTPLFMLLLSIAYYEEETKKINL